MLPALCHQSGPVINPAVWGGHDEAANVHSLLKSSAPTPNRTLDTVKSAFLIVDVKVFLLRSILGILFVPNK